MKTETPTVEKNKFLILTLIVVSIIHIIYASITLRASYMDGAMFEMHILNSLANGTPSFPIDPEHTRSITMILQQFPMMIGYLIGIRSSYWLYFIFSFWLFASPLILVFANWKLSQRTKRMDIFAISVFAYSVLIIPYSIFAVAEISMAALLHLILFNYLSSDINYTKKDISIITFLLITLFGGTEYVMFIGPIFFLAGLYYGSKTNNIRDKIVKYSIAIVGLIASIFVIAYFYMHTSMFVDGLRFTGEAQDYFDRALKINSIISILAIALITIFSTKKSYFTTRNKFVFMTLFSGLFLYMMNNLYTYLYPMLEGHLRTVPFWSMPIIFLALFITDALNKKPSEVFYTNLVTISVICCIFHTGWQINNTYWFNKNIDYLKNTIKNAPAGLYFVTKDKNISSFYGNKDLRRYLWKYDYTASSIVFSGDYKIKTLVMPVEGTTPDERACNPTFAYMYEINGDKITIPRITIDIKNRYWDLSGILKDMEIYIKNRPKDN